MSDFDWDDANRAHLALHGISTSEVEQVIANNPLDLEIQMVDDEERILQIGVTDAGRFLMVATTERRDRLRVVTAFPASPGFQKLYLREKGGIHGDRRRNPKDSKVQK